jgi:hypothetical protein
MSNHEQDVAEDIIAEATPPAPPAANNGTLVRALEFVIHVPDLRNGSLDNIQQAAPKASVAREYKWPAIENLPPAEAVTCVEYIIRGSYAALLSGATGTLTDADTMAAKRRAIVLGSIRAGAAASYSLTRQDMTITEVTPTGYRYNSGRMIAGSGNETATARNAVAQSMAGLEPTEVEVIAALVYLGMAVPALQGVSLVMSGHHYLPTTRNIFSGQKKQALGLLKDTGRAWIEAMGEDFDDMAFHKACHPISPPVKRRLAKQAALAPRLLASGHGAAAIRIPAIPSDAQIGKTGIALLRGATSTIQSMGHSISVVNGLALMARLENASEGTDERNAVTEIQSWAATHYASFAFCAGIVQAVHESSGSGRNTLLAAYSVKKIMSEHASEVNRGVLYARAAAQKTREALADGSFLDPDIAA